MFRPSKKIGASHLTSGLGFVLLVAGAACNFQYNKSAQNNTSASAGPSSSDPSKTQSYAEVSASIFQPKCLGCHSTKEPVLTSYSAVIANLDDIRQDVLVDHSMPRHASLSTDLQAMLSAWISAGAPEGIPIPASSPTPTGNFIPRPYTYANLKKDVLDVKCDGCHMSGNASDGMVLDTYPGALSKKDWLISLAINFDGADAIDPGEQMPPKNSPPLTNAEKAYFFLWAADGYRDEKGVPAPAPNTAPVAGGST